jgi:hypothetical protein
MVLSSDSRTTTDNGYQQRHIGSGSETVTDGSYEPLQMTFYVVVYVVLLNVHWKHMMHYVSLKALVEMEMKMPRMLKDITRHD